MGKMKQNLNSSLKRKLNLKTIAGFTLIGGSIAAALLWFMMRPQATPSACGPCTISITGTSSTSYTVTSGDYVCIASGATYSGTITRNSSSGTGTVNICNEGTISGATFSFSKGVNVIDNRGTMTSSSISFNSGTSSNSFTNYAGAEATFGSFNISRANSDVSNYGTFTTTGSLKMYSGSTFTNYNDATLNVGEVEVGSGSSITNFGDWTTKDVKVSSNGTITNNATLDIHGDLEVDKTFVSDGTLTVSGNFKVNSSASVTVAGLVTVNENLEISKTFEQTGTLIVKKDMTVNSNGRVTVNGIINVLDDLTNNGYIDGPATSSGNYGRINVTDKTTNNSSAKMRLNLDICDAGTPSGGIDQQYGTIDGTVSYCTNSPSIASLPVEWAAFTAEAKPEGVQLNWATAHELNNDHFTVERSTDASSFTKIAEVAGVGNSSVIQSYSATDAHPPIGTIYYRIKQTDIDGQASFSSMVETIWDAPNFSMKVYPNPVSTTATVEILGDKNETGTLRVLDLGGRVVYQQSLSLQPGQTSVELNANTWPSGVYVVEVRNTSGSKAASTAKLIKQ